MNLNIGDSVKVLSKLDNVFSRAIEIAPQDYPQPNCTYEIIKVDHSDNMYGFKDKKTGEVRWHDINWIDNAIKRENIIKESTMKKILAESLQEYKELNEEKEVIKGEIKPGIKAQDVDPKEFLVGMAVEKEHSKDIAVQKTIAIQHLSQNPKYYSEGMKKGMFDEVEAINLYKKYFIDKEEIKESLNESPMVDKNAKYDFAFAHEKVEEEYRYCGFNVKVASIQSERFGDMYYAIADTGEPLLHAPYLHGQAHAAKKEIEEFLDKYTEECETENE
jgi:hypothetical protein